MLVSCHLFSGGLPDGGRGSQAVYPEGGARRGGAPPCDSAGGGAARSSARGTRQGPRLPQHLPDGGLLYSHLRGGVLGVRGVRQDVALNIAKVMLYANKKSVFVKYSI